MEGSNNYRNLTTESVNITNSSLRSEEMEAITIAVYEYLYNTNFAFVLFYYVLLLIILIVGPFLCVTIVLYENFGTKTPSNKSVNDRPKICPGLLENLITTQCVTVF